MEITGIVAEYNPFHNGHLYQIQETKKKTSCDAVVAIMSGHFSQRGEATIVDKFTRTKMALLNGVDLVLELPVPFATASAEFFAQGAIETFKQTNLITSLSFGSECGDLNLLYAIANTSITAQSDLDVLIKGYLKQGSSFPTAKEKALIQYLSQDSNNVHCTSDLLEALQNPNNILGIEYIKAIIKSNASITPYTIRRKGASYHTQYVNSSIASATAIRNDLRAENGLYSSTMPPSAAKLLSHINLPSMEKLSAFLHFKLMFSNVDTLYSMWDIPADLIRTFHKSIQNYPSYEQLVQSATSKTYSRATVQRSLLRLLLNIQKNDFLRDCSIPKPAYIRVLGCRKSRTDLLTHLTSRAKLPVITNLGKQYAYLSPKAKQCMDYEISASKLYAYTVSNPALAQSDYTHPFIVL